MVVFSHRIIPLTSNLRTVGSGLREPDDTLIGDTGAESFEKLLRCLVRAIRKGSPEGEISWDYDYESLWSPRLRDSRGNKINLWKCTKETFIGLLRTRTYWYKRLPRACRERVKLLANQVNGRRKLKDCLDTADGVVTSLLFSFPEIALSEGGYTFTDRVINSVLCNCLQGYDSFQKKLKSLRKYIKGSFLRQSPIKLDFNEYRELSYMTLPIKLFQRNQSMTSKSWIFRLAMFTQTRATGLAGIKQINESIDEFIKTSTTKVEFDPPKELLDAVDQVTTFLAGKIDIGTNPSFRVSMSTSACRESPRRKEGKFGFLKTLVRAEGIEIPPLLEGEAGTIGNYVFNRALALKQAGDPSVMRVNVAAVRENGKARIVTSGSFWKEAALQPFSHITIQLLKRISDLSDGLSAGRLGWKFIQQIEWTEGDKDGHNWIFDRRNRPCLYTTDWKRATDGPTPDAGRLVMGSLLEKTGLDPDILRIILEYWVGVKEIYYKGKKVGDLVRGIPMGDPLTKSNLSLAHPICDLYARAKTALQSFGKGNGDDVVRIIAGPEYAEAFQECATLLGYEHSPDDEVVSRVWGTYCEEFFHLPVARINTCKWGTRFKNSLLLPYLDIPKIRIMLATAKDKPDFSSDPRGKATLAGHDEEYFDRHDPGPSKPIFAIASAFQDVSLALIDQKEPIYLPRQVFGVGKPPPGWSVDSWKGILANCPGWHRKLYLRVFHEYVHKVGGVSSYRGALKPQNHFEKEMMVELYSIPADNPVKKYVLVEIDDWPKFPAGSLEKLVSLGRLIPESKIIKYYLFQLRLMSLEQDLPKVDLFETVKAKLAGYPDLDPEGEEELITRFVNIYSDQPYRLRAERVEPLYDEKVLRILEDASPLAVTTTGYPLIDKFRKRIPPNSEYQRRGDDLYDWFLGCLYSRDTLGLNQQFDPPPSVILDDDPILIQRMIRDRHKVHAFVLVTDDKRLHASAQRKMPGTIIFRMPAIQFIQLRKWIKDNPPPKPPAGNLTSLLAMLHAMEDSSEVTEDDLEVTLRTTVSNTFKRVYGQETNIQMQIDRGNVECFENQYNEDESGILYQTVGIPWTSNIKHSNLQRKPFHGNRLGIRALNTDDLGYPHLLGTEGQHRSLKRKVDQDRLTRDP